MAGQNELVNSRHSQLQRPDVQQQSRGNRGGRRGNSMSMAARSLAIKKQQCPLCNLSIFLASVVPDGSQSEEAS